MRDVRGLDRDYEAVLDFVHEVQDATSKIGSMELTDVCEADEVYVTPGEKDNTEKDGHERGLSKKDAAPSRKTNNQS